MISNAVCGGGYILHVVCACDVTHSMRPLLWTLCHFDEPQLGTASAYQLHGDIIAVVCMQGGIMDPRGCLEAITVFGHSFAVHVVEIAFRVI